jgi:hypothetical protein
MSKLFTSLLSVALALTATVSASAMELDSESPASLVSLGVRAGVNSSNVSFNYSSTLENTPMLSSHNWGSGFSGGLVIDLNLRSFFAIQTGVFADYRHCKYSAMTELQENYITHTAGEISTHYVQIPLLLSLRMRCNSATQVQFDLGPYFGFQIGGCDKYSSETYNGADRVTPAVTYKRETFGDNGYLRSTDVGIKMGVGALFADHYYVGAHYLAGCRNMLRHRSSGDAINKEWQITIGYNF